MPILHEIDEAAGTVTVTGEGDITHEEDLACFGAVLGNPAYRPGMGLLLDYRKRSSVATTDQVKEFVEAGAKLREALGDSRLAVVVSEEIAYGMSRMYSMLAESESVPTRSFRDIGEAMHWLGGVSPA